LSVVATLHRPVASSTGSGYTDTGTIEVAVEVPPPPQPDQTPVFRFDKDDLVVRFRLVPIAVLGPYGFSAVPTASVSSQQALPYAATAGINDPSNPGKNIPNVQFGASAQSQPIPWEETFELPLPKGAVWQELPPTVPDPNDPTRPLGYRATWTLDQFRTTVQAQAGEPFPANRAVEIWVWLDKGTDASKPVVRSVLTMSRHAVLLPPDPNPGPTFTPSYFEAGNLVPALELLPDAAKPQTPAAQFLPPERVIGLVDYGQATGDQPCDDVQLRLAWRLLPEPPDQPFYPVVGFRLYRADRFNPTLHQAGPTGIVSCLDRVVSVIPEYVYRSTPETIRVRALSSPTADGTARYVGDWSIQHAGAPTQVWTPVAPTTPATGLFPYKDDPDRPGVTCILQELMDVAATLTAVAETTLNQSLRFTIGASLPFEDRADVLAATDAGSSPPNPQSRGRRFSAGFAVFQSTYPAASDPYAWELSEALGLSIEITIVDGTTGEPIDLNGMIRDGFLTNLKTYWALANGGAPPTPRVALALFLAADGVTILNVIRLVYSGPWPTFGHASEFDPQVSFLLKFMGRDPQIAWPYSGGFTSDVTDPIDTWITGDVTARLMLGFGVNSLSAAGGSVFTFRRTMSDPSQPNAAPPARAATLPIERDGTVRLDLSVPDRLAHAYDIAVEPLRRYDALWSVLQPGSLLPPPVVPYESIRPITVDRTRPLLPHDILATPLPGSIQAYVFAHPAEFASTSSVLYAAALQYSGHTVTLERRIPDRDVVVANYLDGVAFPFNWDDYQKWVSGAGLEAEGPGPSLVLTPFANTDPLAFQPILPTQAGIYGADRYVYPDLPGYYEYRVIATSTAGRCISPPAASAFVAPLYDLCRQTPRTHGAGRVDFDATKLRLDFELRLVHPRLHLRDELAGLWVACDELIEFSTSRSIRFGSLPDLYLTYYLFIQSNFAIQTPNADETPVLVPLVGILPPFDLMRQTDSTPSKRFLARSGDESRVQVIDPADGVAKSQAELATTQRVPGIIPDPATDFEPLLLLSLELTPQATAFLEAITNAVNANQLGALFQVIVERKGVRSLPVPLTQPPASVRARALGAAEADLGSPGPTILEVPPKDYDEPKRRRP
jgi:hypothetical protein